MSPLSDVLALITQGVHELEAAYADADVTFPSLDDPWKPGSLDSSTKASSNLVAAAAFQLISMVRDPHAAMFETAQSMYFSAALGIVERGNVAEILAAAGTKGLHVDEIGKAAGLPASKLARYLRLLATRNIFREVQPDVFATNRLSSLLDTGKAVEDIQANPVKKHDNTHGFAALIGHTDDEIMRGAGHMLEVMFSDAAHSEDVANTAICRAFDLKVPLWEWMAQPDNELRLNRFGAAMRAVIKPGTILESPIWKRLPPDSLVVDVGGGVGAVTLDLAKARPDLRFIVQDRPETMPNAFKFWENELASALSSGTVQLQAHDFFTPQPVKDASIFLLRFIAHDWATSYVQTIMQHLRDAAQPSTRLVLSDHIVPYGCSSESLFPHIKGSTVKEAPAPLLPNMGIVSSGACLMDMQMLNAVNGQERTVGEFVRLGEATGWKLEEIFRGALGGLAQLVYVPV